jgi:hypothetical protein
MTQSFEVPKTDLLLFLRFLQNHAHYNHVNEIVFKTNRRDGVKWLYENFHTFIPERCVGMIAEYREPDWLLRRECEAGVPFDN